MPSAFGLGRALSMNEVSTTAEHDVIAAAPEDDESPTPAPPARSEGEQERERKQEQQTTSSAIDRKGSAKQAFRHSHVLHSLSTSSFENNNLSERRQQENGRASRLKRATRAILLFRRAPQHKQRHTSESADELSLSERAVSRHQRVSLSKVHQLAASFGSFWRQNNEHASQLRQQQQQQQPMLGAHRSSNWRESGVGDSSPPPPPQPPPLQNDDKAKTQRQDSDSNTSICLPRFIVPKTNALKLPIVCQIKSLDGELMREIFVHRYELGQYLIDNLKVSLGIKDAKYFGLKLASNSDEQEDVKLAWLDLNESVCKQISKLGIQTSITSARGTSRQQQQQANLKSVDFYLRVKFYPPNLARVQDPFLRQYLFLQLRRDLRLGKLTSSMNNLSMLMACVLQYELDDYRPELVSERLPDMNILPNQDMIEQQALDIWRRRLVGLKRHQVQMQFLRASVILETYGFDYYPVRDHQLKRGYLLGFNYAGIKTIRNGRIVHHFRWHGIGKIAYERRMIILHTYPNESSKRKATLGFKCLSNDECQNLYMRLLEQKYFFTVDLAYFDKSIRRPSCLTESSVAEQQPAENDSNIWTSSGQHTSIRDEQQQATILPRQTAKNDNYEQNGDYFASSELDDNNRTSSLDEPQDYYSTEDRASRMRRNFVASNPLKNSNSLDSTQLDNKLPCQPQTRHMTQSASASFDDCPECKWAQQWRMNETGSPSAPQNACELIQLAGSVQARGSSCRQSEQLANSHDNLTSGGLTGVATRASLQRQCSIWATNPTPTSSLIDSTAWFADPTDSNVRDRTNTTSQLVHWLEWLFVEPIRSCCWLPINLTNRSNASLTGLFSHAIRFCLLVVVMNFLVRLSDLIANSLMDLLTFTEPQNNQDKASTPMPDCAWSPISVS